MNITRCLLLVAVLAVELHAREVKSVKLGFKIMFPDAPGWSTATHKAQELGSESWTAESEAARLVLIFTVIDTPASDTNPTFKQKAADWEKGMMTHFTRKISARFARLAGHDAYELVAALEDEQMKVYYSIWMMPVGKHTYGVTIMADNPVKLGGDTAAAFLDSLEIAE
jgi:hypothetical protein